MSESNSASTNESSRFELSHVIVPLLKGPVYKQSQIKLWEQLLQQQNNVVDYIDTLGLELLIDEAEGYAFLRQVNFTDEMNAPPKLTQRRPLSYPVSVLCLLLRQRLMEHDAKSGEVRAIIERRQIRDEISLYLPEAGSEAKLHDNIDRYIKRSEELGLLKQLKDDDNRFEIQRITKALVNPEWLGDLSVKLKEYAEHANTLR